MRILTRYILREVTSHALIGAAIFTFVLFTRDLGHILELVVRASAPLPSVAEIFFYTVPFALTYTIPMSVLVGILIGLSRLAADSEITAMRASGMGVWSFGRSAGYICRRRVAAGPGQQPLSGAMVAGIAGTPGRSTQRRAGFLMKCSRACFMKASPSSSSTCRTFTALRAAQFGRRVSRRYLRSFESRASHWRAKASSSPEGRGSPAPSSEGRFHARDRSQRSIITGSRPSSKPTSRSNWLRRKTRRTKQTPVRAISTGALRDHAASVDPVSARVYLIELQNRFALPTACLVLAMVGIPLGLSSKKSGKSGGFVLTIVLVFVYYFMSLVGVSLAEQGRVGPWFGAWLADTRIFCAGVVPAVAGGKAPL